MPKITASFAPSILQLADLFGIGRQQFFRGEVALLFGDRQLAQRAVERLLHRVLKRAGVVGRQRVALGVAPFVHVEAVHVVAGDAPLREEIHGPAIHAHRPDRQNQGQLLPGVAARVIVQAISWPINVSKSATPAHGTGLKFRCHHF